MKTVLRIGTRDSELATWQATLVKDMLAAAGTPAELVFIKSEGDLDLTSPLYAMGVEGVFTRSLDIALLNNRIDLAVHSMKDVPIDLARGIVQAAVLERASHKDVLIPKNDTAFLNDHQSYGIIATSSIRRRAQWLHRYPAHDITNLRGNVNSRLQKLQNSNWNGAIFAAAGLQRVNLLPAHAIELDWMLPAPAQGAIMVVCRQNDAAVFESCQPLNHRPTEICTRVERDFLKALLGGCSTPISALATIENDFIHFKGNITAPDGTQTANIESVTALDACESLGKTEAERILNNGGSAIAEMIKR